MRKLLLLTALSMMTAGTTGCFHNNNSCRPFSLFGNRQPAPAAVPVQCCQPVQQCCDPCGGATMGAPMMGGPVVGGPIAAPCCQ